jgi:F-type H+-transporting ATPase subunit c
MSRKKLFAAVSTVVACVLTYAPSALAQEAGANEFDMKKWGLLAAGICIAVAALGGALGQGRAAASALDGIARNPGASGKLFVPMILGLALIESLVIYALVISFQIIGKV